MRLSQLFAVFAFAIPAAQASRWPKLVWAVALGVVMIPLPARCADDLFESNAAPLLSKYCVSCHNSTDPQGELDLSSRQGWEQSGESGPILDADWTASLIWERLSAGEMPPEGIDARPTQNELRDFGAWLKAGASWTSDRTLSEFDYSTEYRAGRDWWSFQPLTSGPTPLDTTRWSTHRLDTWVAKRLREANLQASPRASKTQLIRRLSFDLHGLPPSPEAIDEFIDDQRPDAYERLVDRLLASPRYGEHWARHWLDIARFGDTHGYERDFPREHAWPYRDYVIDAFNRDQPYDEFVQWQIAGDVLAPEIEAATIATSFLACGPYDFTGLNETKSPVLRRMARADELDDILATTMAATLGITVNCARCHNHKFDPVSQADYYSMAALLGGIQREDRPIESADEQAKRQQRTEALQTRLTELKLELGRLRQEIDLAEIVGGGTGIGDGPPELGLDPRTGAQTHGLVAMLDDVKPNHFQRTANRFIDGVAIPDGGASPDGTIIMNRRGDRVPVPDTSGSSWDYFQNGPVHSQAFTQLGDIDYGDESHSMLGMHANKLITFDLGAIREFHQLKDLSFTGIVGYGGRAESASAHVQIWVDGQLVFERKELKRTDGAIPLKLPLDDSKHFLTFIATEGQGGISHDQVFFGDPKLIPLAPENQRAEKQRRIDTLVREQKEVARQIDELSHTEKIFGITSIPPPPAYVHLRGNPENHGPDVQPQTLSVLGSLRLPPSASDGERRLALSKWFSEEPSPLFARVMANRIWHYHFGSGIVNTPSDFGFYGGRPSHPELLDALALDFQKNDWSIKSLHRSILTSATFAQSAQPRAAALSVDFDNRFLWRFQPQRLSAEAIRDSVLEVAGSLNHKMSGPGFRDFEVQERYAPIYTYLDEVGSETWRRSIYRFSVRSVPHPLMEVLDCPNPSTVAPKRNRTTTALQALAMLNDSFMLQQSQKFAERLQQSSDVPSSALVQQAFLLAFGREATIEEERQAMDVIQQHGVTPFCRALLNANEFLYIQ